MATRSPAPLYGIYKLIDPYFRSEKIGGVVNANSPGYHTSREDLIRQGRSGNYSIVAPADRRGPANIAAGIDITFSNVSDLILCHKRLRAACTPNASGDYDPRIECVREVIGTLDGRNVSGYNRYPTGSGSRSRVGWVSSGFSDSSHLWHEHISVFRDWADDDNAMRGLAEVIAGVAPGTFGWKGDRDEVIVTPPPPVEEPFVWDGKSYPGPKRLTVGAEGPWVTFLGERLVAHGYDGYEVGPGPVWGQKDTDGVVWFKRKQGWSGGPTVGEATWQLLLLDPAKPVEPVEPEWDGKSYPGVDKLQPGARGPWVTKLGERLVAHGFKGYAVGPGPEYGPKDDEGVVWFKKLQGWSGGPRTGEETWRRLMAAPKPAPKPPAKPTAPTTTPEAPVTHTFTAVFANVLRRTDPEPGRKRWPARVANIRKHITSAKPDLVLAVELDRATAADVYEGLGPGWSYDRFSGIGVFWRQSVFERVGEPVYHDYTDRQNRRLQSIPLRHKASGETVWADVTHLENDGDPKSDGAASRRTEAREMAARTKTGKRVGAADFNSTTRASGAGAKDPSSKPRVILKGAGWSFLSDVSGVANRELASHHGGKGSTPRGAWIDDLFVRGGLKIRKGWLIRTDGTDASDHHFLAAQIEI